MRIALIGASSYQIVGLLNLLYNNHNYCDSNADFYLVDGFFNSNKYYTGLKECGRFDNVYLVKKRKAKSLSHYFDLLRELFLSPYGNARRVTKDNKNSFMYDIIVCESFFPIAVFLLNINPNAKFYLIEDGTCVYNYNMLSYLHLSYDKRNRLYKLFNKKMVDFKNDGLYCYDAEYASVVQGNSVVCKKLASPLDTKSDFWDVISGIFEIKSENLYQNLKIIAIDTHGDVMGDSDFDNLLQKYDKHIVVRPHPRKIDADYSFSYVDRVLDCWEFLCGSEITDDHILVAQYSTAQFVPKVLFDKEPWLIFTWNLKDHNISENDNVLRHIERIKNMYRNKQKVILVDTAEQLDSIISSIIE